VSGAGRLAGPAAVTGPAAPAVYQGSRPLPASPVPSVALLGRFPPRPVPASWVLTSQPKPQVLGRVLASPFPTGRANLDQERRRGLIRVLDWLEAQPGDTWQDRWITSGADAAGNPAWRGLLAGWLAATGRGPRDPEHVSLLAGRAIMLLICADVIRPSLGWLLAPATPAGLSAEMARVRDPAGFAALAAAAQAAHVNSHTTQLALRRIAAILAAKGGPVADITIGDCLELLQIAGELLRSSDATSPYFYQLLRAAGIFGAAAPPGRALRTQGQLGCEQLIDRYGIECRPVRDLLVDYLRERQPAVDYPTLHKLSYVLGRLFWRDLELHYPGIASLHLPAEAAAAWKQRITTKTTRSRSAGGDITEANASRVNAFDHLVTVRAFYLDLAQWAADDPARWGPWAAPCPVRDTDTAQRGKERSRRKSRMDQRTRERIPVLPALLAKVDADRQAAAERLRAAEGTAPGQLFTAAGQTLRRPARTYASTGRTWAQDPGGGKHRDLTLEEHKAFWTWAAVQVLRHTGIRIEELTELSHHSFIQYKLPATGELIPLLQIAPSKTDTERLLVISPELADVLSEIITRIRGQDTAVPLVTAYDYHERVWNPPMPLLFQRHHGGEHHAVGGPAVRELISDALTSTGITDASGKPLRFVPHDFRRIFITDAIMHGMPPHIAQLIAGHRDIGVTLGYKAVYPEEVINAHRAFITRRRALRPAEEYRTPTEEEWAEFLGHFERRKLSLGTCGRSYATPCIHEHACIRCPLLRPDPAQRPRLAEIRDNLITRTSEAHREGWTGEAEGLQVSLAATEQKLAQMDQITARRRATVTHLGMPGHPPAVSRIVTTSAAHPADSPKTPPDQGKP
jgi:Phage integrase family